VCTGGSSAVVFSTGVVLCIGRTQIDYIYSRCKVRLSFIWLRGKCRRQVYIQKGSSTL
jgi:hypothetical protein